MRYSLILELDKSIKIRNINASATFTLHTMAPSRRDDVVHVSYRDDDEYRGVYSGRNSQYRPRRSSTFDVAPDGALPTPLSFKGFTLGAYATNNTATRGAGVPVDTSPVSDSSPARRSLRADRSPRAFPTMVFDDDATQQNQTTSVNDAEEGKSICGLKVLGPLSPIVGSLPLRAVGWSPVLKDGFHLATRVLFGLLACATAIASAVLGWRRRSYFLSNYAAIATLVCARMLSLVASYRYQRENVTATSEKHKIYGYVHFHGDKGREAN